jgi:hypothetical protein
MRRTSQIGIAVLAALLGGNVHAQQSINTSKLINVLPNATGTSGFVGYSGPVLDAGSPNFGALITDRRNYSSLKPLSGLMRPVSIGIAVQLSALPIASPASGVIFKEDPVTGAALPSSDSLGPILTERAETIGKGRFFVNYSRQQFRFDRIEGQKLGNFQTLYRGGDETNISQGGVRRTTSGATIGTQVDLRLDQNVAFFAYGLTDRIDVSVGLTAMRSSFSAQTFDARMINTGDPTKGDTCWCAQTLSFDRSLSSFDGNTNWGTAGFSQNGSLGSAYSSASGLGDTLVRVKGKVYEGGFATVAAGLDLRLPTGDAENYHGAGALGVKPFVAVSLTPRKMGAVTLAPHVNLGYQFNGDSILAGDFETGEKGKLPNQLFYSLGAQVGIKGAVTFAVDYMGMALFNSVRLKMETVSSPGNLTTGTGLALQNSKSSYSMNSMALGFKTKTIGNLVATANVLVALDSKGLRDKVVPLIGLGYTF